ncbi:hypothetical protein ABVT39_000980 [Epinephelus coioides]
MSLDRLKMNFLDVLVLNNNGQLSTTLYRKPADTNSLLHGHSYHPTSLKNSSAAYVAYAAPTLTSLKKKELEHRFRLRGYKEEWIMHASQRFSDSTQSELLNCTRTKGVSCEELTPVKNEEYSLEGSTVTLSYRYSKLSPSDYFYWYRQYPGKPPEFLISHLGTEAILYQQIAGLTIKVDQNLINMNISSAAVTDSAVYYCAVRPTVTAKPQSLYKNTS